MFVAVREGADLLTYFPASLTASVRLNSPENQSAVRVSLWVEELCDNRADSAVIGGFRITKVWANMAHYVGRLTALKVMKVKAPGMYADGAGLYLQVTAMAQRASRNPGFTVTR